MTTPDESVRDMEQVRHSIETKELPSEQIQAESQTSSVRIVTPIYKLQEKQPGSEVHMGGNHEYSQHIAAQNGNYKAERSHEEFRMKIIDPKVNSNAHIPSQTGSLPNYGRRLIDDFPSQHGKRSLLKLDPLEQRRIRSVESRPITTSAYLTESVNRHRDMEESKLRKYLKASEDDANKPWNKPDWPGPKNDDGVGESLRELEQIRKKIDLLQMRSMRRTQSLGELMLLPADDKQPPSNFKPQPPTNEDGWLVKVRTHKYLENAKNKIPSRTRSVGDLTTPRRTSFIGVDQIQTSQTLQRYDTHEYSNQGHPSRGGDELSWQFKKDFHLSKYTDRRRSSFVSETQQTQSYRHESESSRAPTATPLSQQKRSGSQLLYPPGSTDQVVSERTQPQRPTERVVYENKPLPPAVVAVNIGQPSTSGTDRGRPKGFVRPPPQRRSDDDYAERLMSPPPGRQTPKSILKQSYINQQHYSDSEQVWEQGTQIHRQMNSDMPEPPAALMQQPQQPVNRMSNRTPAFYGSSYELDENERMRVMRENLQKHRESRNYTPQNVPRYPTTSFNGPFFKLEEITPSQQPQNNGNRPRSQSVAPVMSYESSDQRRYEEEMRFNEEYNRYQYQETNRIKNMSASEAELDQHIRENAPNDNNGVVIWPPPQHGRERQRPASAMSRSILDPDRIEAYRKQKQMEIEAMRRREERESFLQQRQLHAMQIQQQRVFEQHQQLISEQPPSQRYQPPSQPYLQPPPVPSNPPPHPQQNIPLIHMMSPSDDLDKVEPQIAGDPGMPPPNHMRVFETRPISALSTDSIADPRDALSPGPLNTWRRTYIVENVPEAAAKNEILTSDELLEKERFEVDLLKRREAFIEKPEDEPQIFRTGKRWQPPPEKPYIWPTLRRPVTVEPGHENLVDFAPGPPMSDNGEYRWQPVVYDPTYKKENKNFTPTNSPPSSPRRGHGTGTLDDVAKRQTKYLVQPSPDGSHRPKAAFKPTRQTPSGGFLPHAPNSVKIVKKRSSQIHNSLSPNFVDQEMADVEIIHERNYHRSEEPSHRRRTPSVSEPRSRSLHDPNHKGPLNDWEKIYDLPPHSSTITNKNPPTNVDVRRRLQLFESQAAASLQRRAYSEQRAVESPQTAASTPKAQQHLEAPPRRRPSNASQRPTPPNGGTLLRRADSKTEVSHQHNHHRSSSHRQKPIPRERTTTTSTIAGDAFASRRSSRSGTSQQAHTHYPHAQSSSSAVPMASPMQANSSHHRGEDRSVQVQRRLQRIIQATSPSPAPPSYERARPYMPPPLPPGYKRPPSPQYGYLQQASPRSPPPQQPGNTRRLVQMVQHEAQRHRHDEQRQARNATSHPEYAPMRSGSGPPPPPPQPPQANYHLGPPNMRYQAVSPASSKYAALEPKKNNELDELARKNKELADRSKNRRSDYKLVGSDIIKTDPEPLPPHFKEQIREMLESRISTDTSSLNQNDRSGYVTDASSATWQFNNSFSPRSVVSLNGAKAEDATGLLKVRTTTAPSEDDKPRSIMKRSQLESREQMTYAEPERRIVREAHTEVVRAKPKVTETVETVEDHKRTEEIERRIIRRERRHRSSRHRYNHGHHEYADYANGGEQRRRSLTEEQQRRSQISSQHQRNFNETHQRSHATGLQQQQQQRLDKKFYESASGTDNRSVMHHKIEQKQSYERSHKMASQGSQTVANREKQTALRRYDGRRYTSEELNQAVKRAYEAVDKAHSDIRQWRSNSMQRSGGGQNGYLPVHESYHRSTSTRRDRERDHGDYSRAFDNPGLAHARYGSLSDSLRRGELRYVPNGDFRENYGRSNKMHKSYSSRDVFNDGTRDSSWHRGSVGQGPAPVVEFPPTLPRQAEPPVPPPHRGFSDNNSIYRPIVKSRSYADWDEPRFWKPQNPL